jgi:hypothetical protein
MGVDRDIVAFNTVSQARLWECTCSKPGLSKQWLKYDQNVFFHNCKVDTQLRQCAKQLSVC